MNKEKARFKAYKKSYYKNKKRKERRKVMFPRLNWDTWFYSSIANGDGFMVTQSAAVTLDGKITKSQYGTNSPLFGTSYEDENAFIERHRCECGFLQGKCFEHDICPKCHKPVEEKPINIKMTAWYRLGDNVVINPHWYYLFTKIIGKKEFPQMVSSMERVDKNGNRSKALPEIDYTPLSPYDGIGIDGFYENYDEILDYFAKKRKRFDECEYCKRNKDKAFIHHIPVYSTAMRPVSATADTLYFTSLEKDIHPLFNLTESIRNCEDIEKPLLQDSIQFHVNRIWNYNFSQINKKEGFIRNKLISGAMNYTSRMVINPDNDLHLDEVGLPYQAFRVLYRSRIMYYLKVHDGITVAQAYKIWQKSLHFNQHVYDIMNLIIQEEEPMVLINRNPTINLYSLLRLRVAYVKKPDAKETMMLPPGILRGLNADYDGDVLNLLALPTKEIQYLFRKFDPRRRYILSRRNEGINPAFSLTSTDIVNLYNFATMEFPKAEEGEVSDEKLDETFLPYINQMKAQHEEEQRRKVENKIHIKFPKVKLPDDIMM